MGLRSHAAELGQDCRGQRERLQAFAQGEDGGGLYPEVSFRLLGSPEAGTHEGQKTRA